MLRVLVCGGRDYKDRNKVMRMLDRIDQVHGVCLLIQGQCSKGGADLHAEIWAKTREVPGESYPMEPGESGFSRNERMLRDSRPDLVVHFPGGNGTRHMRDIAHAAGVRTLGGLDMKSVREVME